jgi:3-hydroxyacyl-CoA dehydrogenase
MAPIETADFVGLDVHKAIVDNIYENTEDYAHRDFILPKYVQDQIDRGKLGRKVGQGLYRLEKMGDGTRKIFVWDIKHKEYREVIKYIFPFAVKMKEFIKNGDYDSAILELINNRSLEANICIDFILNYIIYSLHIAELVGYDLRVADDVMATGFTWCPPFAMMEAFSEVCDLRQLITDRLPSSFVSMIDVDYIVTRHIKSNYDYRIYFKAK